MEEHVLGITKLVNHLLGPLVLSVLHALRITPDNPELPVPQHVVMGLVVLVIATFVALFLRSRLSVEKPGATQQAFLYFNWQGIRHHGIGGYLKHFAGPVWWLSPLIFPVEIISTSARLLSLTVRLWANIFASDMIYGIFLSLLVGPALWGWTKTPVLGVILGVFPAIVPLAFIGLHIFVSIIQAYVFTILPSVYIGMATAEEH